MGPVYLAQPRLPPLGQLALGLTDQCLRGLLGDRHEGRPQTPVWPQCSTLCHSSPVAELVGRRSGRTQKRSSRISQKGREDLRLLSLMSGSRGRTTGGRACPRGQVPRGNPLLTPCWPGGLNIAIHRGTAAHQKACPGYTLVSGNADIWMKLNLIPCCWVSL